MDDRLPFSRLEADHLVLVRSTRRRVLTHQDAIHPVKLYVFLYVHVRTPSLLPQLELPLQTDVLNESHAFTVIVTKRVVNALGLWSTA